MLRTAIVEQARFAVGEQLRLSAYIGKHLPSICSSIEQSARKAFFADDGSEPSGQALAFMTDCMPLAGLIIFAGTTEPDFQRAIDWAGESADAVDPISLLSTLTLVYIIAEGIHDARHDFLRYGVWKRIECQVDEIFASAS